MNHRQTPLVLKPGWKRFAVRAFDFLSAPFAKKSTPFRLSSNTKLLLIRNDHLGDIVMTYPAIRCLALAFPQVQMDLLTSSEGGKLLQGSSCLHRIISWRDNWFFRNSSFFKQISSSFHIRKVLKEQKYDAAVDFRGDLRNILLARLAGIHRVISYPITGGKNFLFYAGDYNANLHQTDLNFELLKGLGLNRSWQHSSIESSNESRERVTAFLQKVSEKPLLLIHPGAGLPEKKWPEANYRQVIESILTSWPEYQIGILGTTEEKRKSVELGFASHRVMDLRGQIPLELLPALFERASFFIGNDSGPSHIAAAQNVPSIVLFSQTNRSQIWSPRGDKVKVISCRVHEPMSAISVEQVLTEIDPLIGAKKNG